MLRFASSLRAGWPWMALAAGLIVATEPAWRILLLGFHPTLDDLLTMRCFGLRL